MSSRIAPSGATSLRLSRAKHNAARTSCDDQEFAARLFGICCALSPFVIFGVCYGIVRLFA